MEEKNKQQIIPVQYVPIHTYEEDEIDLKELIRTILKHKYFILIFTLAITSLAAIYAYFKKPIYEIKSNIQVGYISNSNSNSKIYLIEPNALQLYIKGNFDNSEDENDKYPQVDVEIIKKTNDLLGLKIRDFSNEAALDYLNKILDSVKKEEDKKLTSYTENIKSQIDILETQLTETKKQLTALEIQLKSTKDPLIYQTIANNIKEYQDKLLRTKLNIVQLNSQISPLNITRTSTLGKVLTYEEPIKPKKKLIIVVALVTGFFLSIFMVFFMEFVRSFKEE
ncbi:Wzz/FepE/Etk N-terminal domain-containing protein [Deferribacter thermophilus]|uniref:Wzz/FepE/Etk N-terminal domain-containing protein n=1 Tax=Deferribacter thermophilus TaxID=53573 RepID=UPI003C17C159